MFDLPVTVIIIIFIFSFPSQLDRENTYPLIKSRHATPNTIHKEQPPPDLSERKKKPVPLPRHKIGPSPHASNNKTLNNEGSSTPFPKYSCINSKSTSAASEMLHINDDDDNEGIGHDWVIIPGKFPCTV